MTFYCADTDRHPIKSAAEVMESVIYDATCKNLYSTQSDPFYSSDAWRKLRYRVLLAYKACCMVCGKSGEHTELHVDHIEPRSKRPDLELEYGNLQIMCVCCNLGKGNSDNTDWRPKYHDRWDYDRLQAFKKRMIDEENGIYT